MTDPELKQIAQTFETLVDYFLEAHADELENKHYGDSKRPGEDPADCSYCKAIADARVALAKLEVSRVIR